LPVLGEAFFMRSEPDFEAVVDEIFQS
jgi:hypothetical protein